MMLQPTVNAMDQFGPNVPHWLDKPSDDLAVNRKWVTQCYFRKVRRILFLAVAILDVHNSTFMHNNVAHIA